MPRPLIHYRRARTDSRQLLERFHRSHRGTPTLGCPICTFAGRPRSAAPRI